MSTCELVLQVRLELPCTAIPLQPNDKLLAVGMDREHGEDCLVAWFQVNRAERLDLEPRRLFVVRIGELLPAAGLAYVATVPRASAETKEGASMGSPSDETS
jgi:hypothetical protein